MPHNYQWYTPVMPGFTPLLPLDSQKPKRKEEGIIFDDQSQGRNAGIFAGNFGSSIVDIYAAGGAEVQESEHGGSAVKSGKEDFGLFLQEGVKTHKQLGTPAMGFLHLDPFSRQGQQRNQTAFQVPAAKKLDEQTSFGLSRQGSKKK